MGRGDRPDRRRQVDTRPGRGRALPRVVRADVDGRVDLDGIDASTAAAAELLDRVGIVFASATDQLSGSKPTVREELAFGLENLGLPRAEMDDRIDGTMDAWASATSPIATRARCRAGSSSGSRSPRSPRWARGCSCSTSPRPSSIRRGQRPSSTCSDACAPRARRSCAPNTTGPSWRRVTAWRSSSAAGSWTNRRHRPCSNR